MYLVTCTVTIDFAELAHAKNLHVKSKSMNQIQIVKERLKQKSFKK